MPRWFIDLSVWALIFVAIVGLTAGVFIGLRPPSVQERIAASEADYAQQCRSFPQSRKMPATMAEAYCGCLINAGAAYGGGSNSKELACRQRSARRAANEPGVPEAFQSAFPALCQQFESELAGRSTVANTSFCQCVRDSVQKEPGRMAQYVYSGGEGDTQARRQDIESCSSQLDYGSDWQVLTRGDRMALVLRIPQGHSNATDLRFICREGELIFDAIDGFGTELRGAASFTGADQTVALRLGDTGDAVRGLIASLSELDDANSRASTNFDFYGSQVRLHLNGFEKGAEAILRACPVVEREPTPLPSPLAETDERSAPDLWKVASPEVATMQNESPAWQAEFACDLDLMPMMYLSTDAFIPLGKRYPDPNGTFDAVRVPVEVNEFRNSGGNCQRSETTGVAFCALGLRPDEWRHLMQTDEVSVTVGGISLGRFRFGSSRAVQEVFPSCNLEY